ncbi:MAG: hypothetical protein A2162_02375 [Deltaproteobacteria bacterium RBG_13_52_11b]|nr:MAG: hypothetical protein A2162_02375 [Deltaproteobacteria bacterium RBG_13_52_11b]
MRNFLNYKKICLVSQVKTRAKQDHMAGNKKGHEANPFVRAVIELHGDKFWIWKFVMVAVCLVLLCLHSRFKVVRMGLILLMSIYLVTVIYQVLLLSYR